MAYRRTQHEVNPDDDEIEADSLSIPSFRKMAVAYPDEGAIKTQHMLLPSLGFPDSRQQYELKSAVPAKDPWGPLPSPVLHAEPPPEKMKQPIVKTGQPNVEPPEEGTICAERFPSTFRLERTNFAVNSSRSSGNDVEMLVNTLKLAFEVAGIDVVDFRKMECTFKCSYQKGSLFLSFMVTVFLAPSRASDQVLEPYDEDGLMLVEVQLREGDGLYFSGLYQDLVDIVNNQEGVTIAGTFHYRPCATHPYGEGLSLESIKMKHPGHGPPQSGCAGMPMESGTLAADEKLEELDEDMTEDVMLLSGMIRQGFPTVQADAASVVAGLTSTDSFRKQLSMDGASGAASALASASVRLLVETPHRAARRQASVVVANLAYDPVLRAALLASDKSSDSKGTEASSRGLLDSLVLFAVGGATTTTQRVRGAERVGDEEKAGADEEDQEEEIGMRRECMRALLGMSECEKARDTKAMKSLLQLTAEPSGKGATDKILIDQLAACQNVLRGHY